jgi:hypothetical protein
MTQICDDYSFVASNLYVEKGPNGGCDHCVECTKLSPRVRKKCTTMEAAELAECEFIKPLSRHWNKAVAAATRKDSTAINRKTNSPENKTDRTERQSNAIGPKSDGPSE